MLKANSTTRLHSSPTCNSSVAFLQKEHAKTLKGLHAEIQRLQQKCSKLTYELTMASANNLSSAHTEEPPNLLFEKELLESQNEVSYLKSQLVMGEEKMNLLEQEMFTLRNEIEKSHKEKQEIIRSAQYQLEEKSTAITQLVSKLHQTQQLLQRVYQSSSDSVIPEGFLPSPPKEPPPVENRYRSHLTRRLQRTVTSPYLSSSTGHKDGSLPSLTSRPSKPMSSIPQIPPLPVNQEQNEFDTKQVLPPIITNDTRRGSHRHRKIVSKGLNSAPCTMRLVNYSAGHALREKTDDKGMIMVKQQEIEQILYDLPPQPNRK
jgi:coiled-coil domain-containing protein 92